MKNVTILLVLAMLALSTVGCGCMRRVRDRLCRGAYCGPSAVATPAASTTPGVVAAAPMAVQTPFQSPVQTPVVAPAPMMMAPQSMVTNCMPCSPCYIPCDPCGSPCCDPCCDPCGGGCGGGYYGGGYGGGYYGGGYGGGYYGGGMTVDGGMVDSGWNTGCSSCTGGATTAPSGTGLPANSPTMTPTNPGAGGVGAPPTAPAPTTAPYPVTPGPMGAGRSL